MLKPISALAAVATAAALVIPTVGLAADETSVRISYADLNLASRLGQQRLEQRISYAATVVCGPVGSHDLTFVRAVSDCRVETIADAQPAFRTAVASALRPSVTVLDAAALVVSAH